MHPIALVKSIELEYWASKHTPLFLFALCVWTTIDTSLEDLILALEFIFKLVLELPRLVRGGVDHWALAGLESGRVLLCSIRSSL